MDLSEIRNEIDSIDNKIVELFIRRMNCSAKVAENKKHTNAPIFNPAREELVLQHVEKLGKEYGKYARVLYNNIMELSRDYQYSIKHNEAKLKKVIESADKELDTQSDKWNVACIGVSNSNSHLAARKFFPNANISLEKNFDKVFEAVESDKCHFGVLPVENSSAGSVSRVYDLILKYRYYIVGEFNLPIDHCLCSIPQTNLSDIEYVLSQEQGLAQCSLFLSENGMQVKKCSSTSTAAKIVSEEKRVNWAAICNKEAADQYGLKILDENIQNTDDNCTRFIVISKKPIITNNAEKISLCFFLPHKSGSLYSVLCRFASHGMNLTKIESRPMVGASFEYMFYLDFKGNIDSKEVVDLLCALSEELPDFSFLGNYKVN
ncbi:MAG: prephenate dehydratase [Acutalibacteraceae bacterium]|nr:prephenate dehydratase [Acutalibacteraceae bacterium]